MRVKMATLKQRPGATRPGEPQPPPAWMPNTEVQYTRREKLLSELVQQARGAVVEGKAAQSEVVGKLVHATDQLDKMSDKLRFLSRARAQAEDWRTQQITEHWHWHQPGEPAGEVADLLS